MTSWPISNSDDSGDLHRVPISTLFRWYLYDTLGDEANNHIDVFQLTPVSEEGNDKEIEDSESRLSAIEPLLSFITLYSNMNAQCSFEAHRKEMLKIPGITEDMVNSGSETLKEFYSTLTFNGLLAAFSAAVDLKLIKMHGIHTGIQKETNE